MELMHRDIRRGLLTALLIGSIVLAGCLSAFAQGGVWSTQASMPTARAYVGAGEIDGRLYVVGGGTPTAHSGATEAYDPGTNTWATKAVTPPGVDESTGM